MIWMSMQKVNMNNLISDSDTKPVVEEKSLTHAQLLAALYWCYDSFSRVPILFFPIFDTAKQIMKNDELSGTHLDIGVRELEWYSGGKSILDAFIDHFMIPTESTGNIVTYKVDGVPIRIHILKDDVCLTQCDTVLYEHEDFKIPNPYERFEKIYGS